MARILIVDDNLDLAVNMNNYLCAKAHEVTEVHCVEEAFDALAEKEFDLLLLDWELPDGTGLEICRAYRKRDGVGAVLMLTGRSSPEDKVEGLNAGADDYMAKPFNIKEFGARVDAQLRRYAMQKTPDPIVFDETFVGKTLAGTYLIEDILGKGNMGFVYKAKHKTLNRVAAIKVLSSSNVGLGAKKRFEREAQAMSKLDHPNLIKIYEFGFAERSTPYIVMEYVEGAALNQILKYNGPLSVSDAIPLFIEICDGLFHAHAQSLVHRDLKPANIIVSSDNHAKVVDLGLVKYIESENGSSEPSNELSIAGEVFGSPAYMSPEQGTGKTLDQRSDINSFACLMYQALCNELAYKAESFVDVINDKIQTKPPSLCERFPELKIPAELDRCIRRAMDPSIEKRHSTMQELKRDLEGILQRLKDDRKTSSSHKILSYVKGLLGKKP